MQSLCCVCRSQWKWKCGAVVVLFDKRVSPSVLECTHYSADHCLSGERYAGAIPSGGWKQVGCREGGFHHHLWLLKLPLRKLCSFRLPCSVSSSSSSIIIGKHYRAVPVTICSEATLWCVWLPATLLPPPPSKLPITFVLPFCLQFTFFRQTQTPDEQSSGFLQGTRGSWKRSITH